MPDVLQGSFNAVLAFFHRAVGQSHHYKKSSVRNIGLHVYQRGIDAVDSTSESFYKHDLICRGTKLALCHAE